MQFQLPSWLQYVVAFSSIVSIFGLFVAFYQITVSQRQFKDQLKTSTDQFVLLNQGYLVTDIQASVYSPQLTSQTSMKMKPGTSYESVNVNAILENSGNTPIIYTLESCNIFFQDNEVYNFPVKEVGKSVLYPKQKSTFGLGGISFNQQKTLLTVPEIEKLKIICKFKFSYNDFNSIKVHYIDRIAEIHVGDYQVLPRYKEINDQL